MKKTLALILISATGLVLADDSITVINEDTLNNEVLPVYINLNTGLATGYSFTNNYTNDSGKSSGATTNNYSLGANIGYNFNRYFALEAGYDNLWLSSTANSPSGQVGVEDIAVKGTIPLGSIFEIYGRAGLGGYQNISGSDGTSFANNLGVLYAAGAQWNLNRHWALRAEDWSVTGLGNNIIQFGAQLSF